MKKLRLFSVLSMVLVLLMTAVPAFAADPDPGSGNTDVVVVNTNQDTGAVDADVTALYYDTGGTVVYNRNRPIPSRGSFAFLAADTTLGDGWEGAMILQSDYELAANAEITWEGGSSTDGITAGSYRGYAFGATEMYLPFVVYAPNAQFTRVSIQNTEDTAASITMEYINRDGDTDFTFNDTLQGLASKTYDMHAPGSLIPVWANSNYFNTNGFWGGALKITSTSNKEIAAVATNHWAQWAVSFNGAGSGASTNYIPSVERRCTTCMPHNTGTYQGFSVIIAQCLEASTDCNVEIDYVNSQTGTVDGTLTRTLSPGAALGANTKGGGDFDSQWFETNLGKDQGTPWVGSAIVSTSNNTDVAVIAYTIRPGTKIAGSTSGANASDGGAETFLPAIYASSESCPPGSDWTKYSLIRIQNPTTTDANVDIYYFDRDGNQDFLESFTVQAEKSFNRNTRVHCADIPLGTNWEGSVYIDSDQPVVAVSETIWGSTKMNAYNGYSVTR